MPQAAGHTRDAPDAKAPASVPHLQRRWATDARKTTYVVAVVGNPNSGKTTLFNALTGLRHKVGNYPGVTVEKREGLVAADPSLRLLDLPGTYSLSARSLDEQIARDVLLGRLEDDSRPDAALIVADAANLERNLYLASQVIELGIPTVIACNMMDLLEAAGHRLDTAKLSAELGVPVIPTVAHHKEGVGRVCAAVRAVCRGAYRPPRRRWTLPERLELEVMHLKSAFSASGDLSAQASESAAILSLSEQDGLAHSAPDEVRSALRASLERLSSAPPLDISSEIAVARYAWLEEVLDRCLTRATTAGPSLSDRLDHVLTHKIWGMLAFVAILGAMFCSMFQLTDPLTHGIELAIGAMKSGIGRLLPAGPLTDLLRDGVIAGVGNVLSFFPQIWMLFLFIALLEDSGYMARAAFLMDRLMSRVGLHGKSFIPLLSCHACAVPGIMATRTIEHHRDRLTTILVAPLITCSARLPVYTVLIAACLPGSAWLKAGVLLAVYLLGIIAALTMATVFKKTLLRGPTPSFIMELPPYRRPRALPILRMVWDQARLFLSRAGTVILAITVLLWAMMNYPVSAQKTAEFDARRQALLAQPAAAQVQPQLDQLDREQAASRLHNSFAGRLGHVIEPAIRPLGYDWKIGLGILASFTAREVFVGTMAVAYSVGDAGHESAPLREQLASARWPDGHRVFTPLVGVGLIVFYLLACQCISTIATVRKETGGWRWPAFMFAYMSVLAYTAALLVYQIGSALHLGTT